MGWPLWIRALLGGVVWGGAMYAFTADGARTVAEALIYVVGGAVFGVTIWAVLRAQERHLVGPLSDAERAHQQGRAVDLVGKGARAEGQPAERVRAELRGHLEQPAPDERSSPRRSRGEIGEGRRGERGG